MKIKFNITVEYNDDYIAEVIKNHEHYALETNTICPKIEDILVNEIEYLIMDYTNADKVIFESIRIKT